MLGSAGPRGLGAGSPHTHPWPRAILETKIWEVNVGNFTGREGASPRPDHEQVTTVSTSGTNPLGDPGKLRRTALRVVPQEEAGDVCPNSGSLLAMAAVVNSGLSSCSRE